MEDLFVERGGMPAGNPFAAISTVLAIILQTVSAGIDHSLTTNGISMRSSSLSPERNSGFGGQLMQIVMFMIFWLKRAVIPRPLSAFSLDWSDNSVNHVSS